MTLSLFSPRQRPPVAAWIRGIALIWLLALPAVCQGIKPSGVLVVANDQSALSRRIAEYYISRRSIPLDNYCHIKTTESEIVPRNVYEAEVEGKIGVCLKQHSGAITAIVLTQGVPLRIQARQGTGQATDGASVDSELALFFQKLRGVRIPLNGSLRNPYFGQRDAAFDQNRFPMYLVTRLAAQKFEHVQRMIDASVAVARDPQSPARGKVVLDLRAYDDTSGNDWLRNTAIALPRDRVVIDESNRVITGEKDVIGYASWGSNDKARKDRRSGFSWLPGSVATEFVSTDGRTFAAPPETWNIGPWSDKTKYFAGSPQSLSTDLLAEGASAVTGHVDEPYLGFTPRPDYLLPAYLVKHRSLAEAFYSSIPVLSWQNILIGDPLMCLRPGP